MGKPTQGQEHLSRWIPLATRLPHVGDAVLAYWTPTHAHRSYLDSVCVAMYSGHGRWHNPEDDEDDYAEPSYWMPLPPPPSVSVDAQENATPK